MTNEAFIKICLSLITIFGTLVSIYVIPFVHARLGQVQLDKVMYYVDLAVRCADQIYSPEEWMQKKEYVVDYITHIVNNVMHLTLSAQDIDVLIEGVVNSVHMENKRND